MINVNEKKENYNLLSKFKKVEDEQNILYKKISGNEKKLNYYFTAIYLPDENNKKKVKILDENFIESNKNKCKIIYNNKIYELKEYFEDIDINYNHKDLIKCKLLFINNIIDMSYMFYDCDSLISLSFNNETNLYISKLQMYIINMSYMFYECKSLISLPDISKLNTSYVEDMSFMNFGCNSSLKLPDVYIFNKNKDNIIFELTYKNKNKGYTKILDKYFIERNRNRCSIIYNNCEFELKEYFENIDNKHKDTFKVLLCLDKNINDLSYIFFKCDSLISIEYYQMDYHINETNDNSGDTNYFNSIKSNSNTNDNINSNDSINICNDSKQNKSTISQNNTNFLTGNENFKFIIPYHFIDLLI